MNRQEEVTAKVAKVREFLQKEKLDGLVVSRWNNFAWLSAGGSNYVVSGADAGVASLIVTHDKQFFCTDTIEAPRIEAEELAGLGFKPVIAEWHAGGRDEAIAKTIAGQKVASDLPVGGTQVMDAQITQLRWQLLPVEIERYRTLGKDCAAAMTETCKTIQKGMSEWQVGSDIAGRLLAQQIQPAVLLIAADERIRRFRHPIPKDNPVNQYCMIVICGQRHGLVLSMTRLVHFGPLSEELKQKHQAVAEVDAAMIAATKPGATAGDVFTVLTNTYAKVGFADEWRLHHQGGAAGYAGRDWKATRADDPTPILENQAFAWNPSITGTKSEDTIICTTAGQEVISPTPELPTLKIATESGTIERSDIFIR